MSPAKKSEKSENPLFSKNIPSAPPISPPAQSDSLEVQQSGSSTGWKSESEKFQTAEMLEVQHAGRPKSQKSKGDRMQLTIYLPPRMAKWVRVRAPVEEREISEILTDALELYIRSVRE